MKNKIFKYLSIAALIFSVTATAEETGTITGSIKVRGVRDARNIVVYIEKIAENKFEPPKEPVKMDQVNLVFIPRVLPILKGTTVDYHNSDELLHNVFSPDACAEKMNLGTWGKGEVRSFTFKKNCRAAMLCNVHPEMLAYVVALDNPFYTLSDVIKGQRSGAYTIKNVPPGKYTLLTWHEKLKTGEVEVEVKAGQIATADFSLKR